MCRTSCKLCNKIVISSSVSVVGGVLVINIPQRAYNNGSKYCIVIAQDIPAAATIYMPVAVTIGTSTTQYPLMDCDCVQVVASALRQRMKYTVTVHTSADSGTFRLAGKISCAPSNDLESLPAPAPAPAESASVASAFRGGVN